MSCTISPVGVRSKKSIGRFEQPIEHMVPDLDVGPGRQEQHDLAPEMAERGIEQHQHREGDA